MILRANMHDFKGIKTILECEQREKVRNYPQDTKWQDAYARFIPAKKYLLFMWMRAYLLRIFP